MKSNELKELLERATKGPWWNESGIIHAKDKTWRPDNHACCHPCKCEEDADADLVALTPELAAELIRCRELLEQAVYESMGMSFAAKCGPLPFVAEAKKYLSEAEVLTYENENRTNAY